MKITDIRTNCDDAVQNQETSHAFRNGAKGGVSYVIFYLSYRELPRPERRDQSPQGCGCAR